MSSVSNSPSGALVYVGLDVHKDTIAVAVAPGGSTEVRSLGIIPSDVDSLLKVLRKLGQPTSLRVAYEAGPCGYVLYRALERKKIACVVVAPSLIPRKPGNHVKTDRRDACNLARMLRNGDLTSVWVPDAEHEALRDLVRARDDAKSDQLKARQRLGKMLLRLGIHRPAGVNAWSAKHTIWLDSVRLEQPAQQLVFIEYRRTVDELDARLKRLEAQIAEFAATSKNAALIKALQALRGVRVLTATTLVAEIGDLTRFERAPHLMGYIGIVPSEYSSGARQCRGGITKSGNAHVRRALVEAAWHYRTAPNLSRHLRERQAGLDPAVCDIAWRAQQRLCKRFRALSARGKVPQKVVVALAREMLGFIWAIGRTCAKAQPASKSTLSAAA